MTTKKYKTNFPGLDSTAQKAFEKLKVAFTTAPVLQHFNPTLPSTIVTDASDFALSAIHLQPDSNSLLHPVLYYSHKLTPAEINYKIHDKELLGIVKAFREWCAWLVGFPHTVTAISDHSNLRYFMASQLLNRCQARWSSFLSEFDFQLDYAPGTRNPADAASQRQDYKPQEGDETTVNQRQAFLNLYHTAQIFPSEIQSNTPSSINSLSTYTLDNSELLNEFKTAYRTDTKWQTLLQQGDKTITQQDDLVLHNGHLFVPSSL